MFSCITIADIYVVVHRNTHYLSYHYIPGP